MNLAEAKPKLTVPQLWEHFHLPGKASASCLCPFHEDRIPSFSVREDGAVWHCFAGCGSGDAVDFLQMLTGLAPDDACREFIRLAGGQSSSSSVRAQPRSEAERDAKKLDQRSRWPRLENPLEHPDDTPAKAMSVLARLRHVSEGGVRLTAARGLLRFAPWKDKPSWIVTDRERINAQARRMDGKLWPMIEAKAQTLPGSVAGWPIGLAESKPFPVILLCEGGPDLLACHHFIAEQNRHHDVAAVALLGASHDIKPEHAKALTGKRVRIMPHADEAGREAAGRWTSQLYRFASCIDGIDLRGLIMENGQPVKDVNDLTRISAHQASELQALIPR